MPGFHVYISIASAAIGMPAGSGASLSYQAKVTATVEAQCKRADANQLFKIGDIAGAVVAYEAALADVVLDEDRLPLLSNLGFCHLKLAAPESSASSYKVPAELDAARDRLQAGLSLGAACFKSPVLAAKVAGRLLEAYRRAGDTSGERACIAECRFYQSVALEKRATPPTIALPEAPPADKVTALLMAIGSAEDDEGVAAVVGALNAAAAESLDEHRMNGLCLAVHISALRGGSKLLEAVLATGAPPDARHEQGRTALMLAANNGRLDLCTMLLDAGARCACVA